MTIWKMNMIKNALSPDYKYINLKVLNNPFSVVEDKRHYSKLALHLKR
jgi:hypothetical protein